MNNSMGVYKKRNKLWVNFTYYGIRCFESLGITDSKTNRKYAERLLAEIKNKIALGVFNYAEYFPQSSKLELFGYKKQQPELLKNVSEEYIKLQENRHESGIISHSTLKNTKKELKYFTAHFGNCRINDIKQIDIETWLVDYSKTRKAKTVNNSLSTIKQMFKYAKAKEYTTKDVTSEIKFIRQEKPDIEPFSLEEMKAVLNYFHSQYNKLYPLIAFLFFTGCRTGEALAAKWENLDTNNWTYYIKESFSNHRLTRTKTKSSNRVIDIIPALQKILKTHKANSFLKSEYIFLNSQGQPFHSSNSIRNYYWTPALKRLGIRYRTLYQTRHTYAVLNLIAGENPHYIAQQLGHSDMSMLFTKYARFIENYRPEKSRFDSFISGENVTISLPQKEQDL